MNRTKYFEHLCSNNFLLLGLKFHLINMTFEFTSLVRGILLIANRIFFKFLFYVELFFWILIWTFAGSALCSVNDFLPFLLWEYKFQHLSSSNFLPIAVWCRINFLGLNLDICIICKVTFCFVNEILQLPFTDPSGIWIYIIIFWMQTDAIRIYWSRYF